MTTPLPHGFHLVLDQETDLLDGDTVFGGSPVRILRLSGTGARAWRELRTGCVRSAAAAKLGRTLTDAGLAHPRPPAVSTRMDVTVVIPVRDRAELLDGCLSALGETHPVVVVDDGSAERDAVAKVAAEHGATLIAREYSGGPGVAREDGLRAARTELVAFLDSDCLAAPGWIEALVAHFADPLVGAAAPRIVPAARETAAQRYAAAGGSLDMGERAGRVAAGARVGYVPTAALLVRRAALAAVASGDRVFDPALRYGEDVDLVRRLDGAGWRIRYEPAVRVPHREPRTWPALLERRYRYGTSAGPLARRHPGTLAPLIVRPWSMAAVLCLLAGRPAVAGAVLAADAARIRRKLRPHRVPAPRLAVTGAYWSGLGLARYATQFGAPLLLAGLAARRTRFAAAALLAGPALVRWATERPPLDPVRFTAAQLAEDIAYGAGVLAGSWRARTSEPVRPRTKTGRKQQR